MIKKIFSKEIFFLPLLLLTLFVSVNKVNADESNVASWSYFYTHPNGTFAQKLDIYNNYSSEINNLISYFNNNWSISYDYYYIDYFYHTTTANQEFIVLFPTSVNNFSVYYSSSSYGNILYPNFHRVGDNNGNQLAYYYNISTNTFGLASFNFANSFSIPILTNFDYSFVDNQYDKLILPSFSYNDYNFVSYELFEFDTLPTVASLSDGSYNTYTEIDLNNYDYIILSLKDYNIQPFYTNIYTLGKLCFTPVYNYGMTEKKDIFSNYQTQSCTGLYDTYTPVNISISQNDIDNNSVFYIKSYNSNAVNKIKVNSSKFNITYITSDNSSDPQVSIGGRSYPVIPFNQLTDTANKSTDVGYISGQSCSLGDINCEYETGIGLDISDLWSQPLKVLQSVWTSITSVFTLITSFIALIPTPLKEFLISAFMLAIILGILKILL